jgi:urease accessory protein UreE
MYCASIHRPAGHWPKEKAAGSLTLDFDTRHRRRIRLTTEVLLDLPKAIAMADGDALQLEDGRLLKVQAAAGKDSDTLPSGRGNAACCWPSFGGSGVPLPGLGGA